MKKHSLLLILFTLSSVTGILSQNKVSFGIEVTPSVIWSSSNIKNTKSAGAAVGIGYGIAYMQMVTENWGYSSGITMNHYPYKITYNSNFNFETYDSLYQNIPAGATVEYKIQGLNIPLGLLFRSRQIGYTKIVGEAGLLAGYNIKTKIDIEAVGVEGETAKKEIKPVTAGYYFGAGIHYSLGGSTAVKCVLSFSSGLTDLTNDRNHRDDIVTSHRVGLSLGVLF
ncbi:MAG TPA: outer membrane beta-barrel protein [Salinivirgaceae bacterium]|nr:outer membrane beta-barrel protein [Salinivirgaceae bacterium]